MPSKINEDQNRWRPTVSRIQEMKGGKYAKVLSKIQVSALFHKRDIRRIWFTWVSSLYGDAVLDGHQTWRPVPTETLVIELRCESVNSTLKELINIKESREARGRPIKCQGGKAERNEVDCVTGEGGFQHWLYVILEGEMYLIPFWFLVNLNSVSGFKKDLLGFKWGCCCCLKRVANVAQVPCSPHFTLLHV